MVTKGIITEVISDYKAKVRIPLYDSVESAKGSTLDKDLSIATVCTLPNLTHPVDVGDVVYVSFEDGDKSKPVILGHLHKENKTKTKVNLDVGNITTNSTTQLGYQTSIGNIRPAEIAALSGIKDNIQNQIDNSVIYSQSIISNPNLLINGDFRVNQRGKTSYTHTGEAYGYTYFVDRWFAWGENPFTFDASTKTLTPNASNTYNSILSQWIEDVSGFLGKTITYSVSVNNIIYSITRSIPTTLSNNVSLGELSTSFGKLRVWSNNNRLRFDIIVSYPSGAIVLNYAKVEIGSVATAFSPRPYAEELAMCQRYYQNIETQIARASIYNIGGINFYVPLPVTLRTVPTLTLASGCGIQSLTGGQIDTGYSISVVSPHHSNILHLRAIKENTSYQDCVLNFQRISSVDAEIY